MELVERIVGLANFAAARGYGPLSTGEQLTVALVLNRPDWLAEMDYTLAEAIDRIGAEWMAVIPEAARAFEREKNDAAYAAAEQSRADKLAVLRELANSDAIDLQAELVTYGSAPGYRDATLVLDLTPPGRDQTALRASVRILPQDAESIVRHLREVHQCAWDQAPPLDLQPGEKRPAWIDR